MIAPAYLTYSPQGMEVATALGVVYCHPSSVFLNQWNGSHPERDLALEAGMKLVLTVRNSGPWPTAPPTDLADYQLGWLKHLLQQLLKRVVALAAA